MYKKQAMLRNLFFLSTIVLLFSLPACVTSLDVDIDNEAEIQQYIEDNGLHTQVTESGLHYVITQEGDGTFPSSDDVVTVNYKGYYTDGFSFDNLAQTDVNLANTIDGWTEGVPLISRGGSAIFIIPSSLGYANNPPDGLRRNAVLVFEIDLLDF